MNRTIPITGPEGRSIAGNAVLHRQRGTVEVVPYRGEHPLYRHGFLKVSADRRSKRFTLLQVAPMAQPKWAGQTGRDREAPFHDEALARIDPAYWQAFERRIRAAWRSWLSGAKGCTYGAGESTPKVTTGNGGIWTWVTNPDQHDFLSAIKWWRLEPAPELIRSQPEPWTHRRVLARSPERDSAVACLPDNEAIEVDLAAFSVPLAVRWFDPVRGRFAPESDRVKTPGVHRLAPPAKGDWVLALERSAAPRATPRPPALPQVRLPP